MAGLLWPSGIRCPSASAARGGADVPEGHSGRARRGQRGGCHRKSAGIRVLGHGLRRGGAPRAVVPPGLAGVRSATGRYGSRDGSEIMTLPRYRGTSVPMSAAPRRRDTLPSGLSLPSQTQIRRVGNSRKPQASSPRSMTDQPQRPVGAGGGQPMRTARHLADNRRHRRRSASLLQRFRHELCQSGRDPRHNYRGPAQPGRRESEGLGQNVAG